MSREEAWGAHLVVKVKEPQTEEFGFLRDDMVLFTYLHLAAYPSVGEALLEAGTAAIAYETVQLENGSLPLLCLLYTSPSPRDYAASRMPSSA